MPKYNYEYNENDYKTPPILYQEALDRWGIDKFDLDVCTTDFNIPARTHYTKEGLFAEGTQKLLDNDGLTGDWMAGFCWCNPPFNECKKWIEKAFNENKQGAKVAMLLPVRTETKYWRNYISGKIS